MGSSTQIETATANLLQPVCAKPLLPVSESSTQADAAMDTVKNSIWLDQQLISQIVLKWHNASGQTSLLHSNRTRPSANFLAAMHGLIKRIAQLKSAHELEDSSYNPEILLPLVLQEAEDVLKQLPDLTNETGAEIGAATKLESGSNNSSEATSQQEILFNHIFLPDASIHPVQPIRALASWLLWNMAQGTHETMRLLEGIPAQVSVDRQTWQSGVVRLVAVLDVQTAHTQSLDLVTLQAAPSSLPGECAVQIQASLLGQQTTSVEALLQRLMPQLITTAPTLQPFLSGFPIELLVPHQAWQTGQVCLRLELEFMPTEHSTLTGVALDRSLPAIKFTNPAWLEQHITAVVEDQLTQVLLQQPGTGTDLVQQSDALLAIVRQGWAAIDALQHSLTLASRTFAQQILPLDELGLRLLWGVNRSSYEVMQWLSGVQVRLLQPQQGWTTGILRFGIYLVLRTPEQEWRFDLVQRCLTSVGPAIAEDAIVQSCESRWCLHPVTLSDLTATIWQPISQATPEILLLCSETEVNVTHETFSGQLGVIQLQTACEFTASENFGETQIA